jgi:hypothetical protein
MVLSGLLRPSRGSKDGEIPRNESVGVYGVKCAASVVWVAADEDEGKAWDRPGEALRRLGREHEARKVYEAGSGQGGMAGELGAALASPGEQACLALLSGKTKTGMWGIIKKIKMCKSSPKSTPRGDARSVARVSS